VIEALETFIGLILSPVAIVAAGAAIIAIFFLIIIIAVLDMVDKE